MGSSVAFAPPSDIFGVFLLTDEQTSSSKNMTSLDEVKLEGTIYVNI